MHWARWLSVFWMVSGCLATAAPGAPPAATKPLSPEDQQAVESLLHSAEQLYHSPAARARAGRLVAIAHFVSDLDPKDPRTLRLLGDVYHSFGRLDEAFAAARTQFQNNPNDYSAGLRWLRFNMGALDRADQRVTLLKEWIDTPSLPASLRSAAATEIARIYLRQGAESDATSVLKTALQLDPLNDTALISRLELIEKPTLEDRLDTVLPLLRANPRAWWVAQEMAQLAGEVGLHSEAIRFHQHAWKVLSGGKKSPAQAPADLAKGLLSALLDAGEFTQAADLFSAPPDALTRDEEFLSLLIEACRKSGRTDRVGEYLRLLQSSLDQRLKLRELQAQASGDKAKTQALLRRIHMDLAWFFLLTQNRPLLALRHARNANKLGAEGEGIQLLLGAGELASGNKTGIRRLEGLIDHIQLAAVFAAEHYFAQEKNDEGRRAFQAGLKLSRKDLSFRKLAAMAKLHSLDIPAHSKAKLVGDRLDQLRGDELRMGSSPELFFHFKLEAPQTVVLAEPIRLKGILKNTSTHSLPMGPWGVVDRRVGVRVDLYDRDRLEASFTSLPVMIWPAPKHLKSGESLEGTIRLDVGALGNFLAHHPLKEYQLVVHPILCPTESAEGVVVSNFPSHSFPAVKIRRLSPDANNPVRAYQGLLTELQGTFVRKEAPLENRLRSARALAGLLGWIRKIEQEKTSLPEHLKQAVRKEDLLALMALATKDPRPVVRAEMTAALSNANLGEAILNQLGVLIEDPNPLVRFRVIELLGATGSPGHEKMLDKFSKDSDARVRKMAKAFEKKRSTQNKKGSGS